MSMDEAKQAYVEAVESFQVGWLRQGDSGQGDHTVVQQQSEDKTSTGKAVAVSAMAYDDDEATEDTADLFGYARQNNLDGVRHIISKQRDLVDSKDEDGLTALHHACDRGNVDMAKLLIELGADIDSKTNEQETPLHYACISEQLETAQVLLCQGCDESARDSSGETAFEQSDPSFIQQLGRQQT
ncbi:ankyrin repeat-containing domain protein [Zychaea mexicana]|uniref:ankyrin repeat-containing domain protein n=1 Tax=Zychaea mexicana TaxID=64656 RepID=UPI0022FF4478|nr:ankyrin repeat-containing domain protein [Zychaea mexicana]KAI9479596.1 ankyrin repeat-containing domain protein [Zychaea mexicana]